MMWKVEGIRETGRPKNTWWDCIKDDMKSLDLFQDDAQFLENENQRGNRLKVKGKR